MRVPVIVNLQIVDMNNKKNIVGAVIDMHPSNIAEIINGSDENTTTVYTIDKRALTLMHPFKEVLDIYLEHNKIYGMYKDEVFDYLKDNWKPYRDFKNDNNRDSEIIG